MGGEDTGGAPLGMLTIGPTRGGVDLFIFAESQLKIIWAGIIGNKLAVVTCDSSVDVD